MLEIFKNDRIIFLIIYTIIGFLILLFAKLKIKSWKYELLYFRIISILIILGNLLCRLEEGRMYGYINGLPTTFCSVTGFLLPLIVLFGKKNLGVYQALMYMGVIGGVYTIFVVPFVSPGVSVLELNILFSSVYHGLLIILCISMIMFGWFKPELKKCYCYFIVYCFYITLGTFEINVLGAYNAMCINSPLVKNTPLNCWIIFPIGTVLVYLTAFIYEQSIKIINKKKEEKGYNKL